MASERVSARGIVYEVYDEYLKQADKERKIRDVKELVGKLVADGLIIERQGRRGVSFDEREEKAEWPAEGFPPSVEGQVHTSGFAEDIEQKLCEISKWTGTAISLKVETEKEWDRRSDPNPFETERLENLGFAVSTKKQRHEAGVTYILEARKVIARKGTAIAYLRASAIENVYDDC